MKLTQVFSGVVALAAVASAGYAQTTVANISEAKALFSGTQVNDVTITGSVVITSDVNTVQPSRNQFNIQDNSGPAGAPRALLIDDSGNILDGNPRTEGTTVTGLRGNVAEFNGQLQFVPISTGTPIFTTGGTLPEPYVVQVGDNFEDIESVLVRVNGVSTTGLPANWAANQTTTITMDPAAPQQTAITRIRFQGSSPSPLIGQAAPAETFDVIGTVRQFNADQQVLPTKLEHIVVPSSISTSVSDWTTY